MQVTPASNLSVHNFRDGSPLVVSTVGRHRFRKAGTADDDFVVHDTVDAAEHGVEGGVGCGGVGGDHCRAVGSLPFKLLQCPSGESVVTTAFDNGQRHCHMALRKGDCGGGSRIDMAVHDKTNGVSLRFCLQDRGDITVARIHFVDGESTHIVGVGAQFGQTVSELRSGLNGVPKFDRRAAVSAQRRGFFRSAIDKAVLEDGTQRIILGNLPCEEHFAVVQHGGAGSHRRSILAVGRSGSVFFQFQQGKFNRSVILIHQCRKVLRSRRNLRATQFIVAVADLGEDVAFCKCIGSRVMGRTESFPRGKGDIHHLDELCLIGFIQLRQRDLYGGHGAIRAQHLPNIFRDKFQHAVIGRQLADEGRNHHTVGKAIGLIARLVIDIHCRRGILNISVP